MTLTAKKDGLRVVHITDPEKYLWAGNSFIADLLKECGFVHKGVVRSFQFNILHTFEHAGYPTSLMMGCYATESPSHTFFFDGVKDSPSLVLDVANGKDAQYLQEIGELILGFLRQYWKTLEANPKSL